MKIFKWVFLICVLVLPSLSFGQGKSASLRGMVSKFVIHEDSDSDELFTIQVGNQELNLISNTDLTPFSNKEVYLTGRRRGKNFFVSRVELLQPEEPMILRSLAPGQMTLNFDGGKQQQEALENNLNLPPEQMGSRYTYVVGVKFLNNNVETLRPDEMYQKILDTGYGAESANKIYLESSMKPPYNSFVLNGAVHPRYILLDRTDDNCSGLMLNTWTSEIKSKLAAEGVNLAVIKSFVFLFPPIPGCSLQAVGGVGIKGNTTLAMNVWIQMLSNAVPILARIVAHEVGHNMGLLHTGAISSTGQVFDADHRDELMASGTSPARMPNLYHRLVLGWFFGKVTTINGPGVYELDLDALEHVTKKTKGVIISLRDASGNLNPESRFIEDRASMMPFNDLSFYPGYRDGILIQKGLTDMASSSSRSYILDATPETLTTDDAPLPLNRVYSEPQYGLTIEFTSYSLVRGAHLRITVTQ